MDAAKPLLQKLSTVKNSDLDDGIDGDIDQLLKNLNPRGKNFTKPNATESLELINNICLIGKILEKCVDKGSIGIISNLMDKELKADPAKIEKNNE